MSEIKEIRQLIQVENRKKFMDMDIDQTVLCSGGYFRYLDPTYKHKSDDKKLEQTFSNPLIYCPFLEDVQHVTKVSKLAGLVHKPNDYNVSDKYSDDDAETQYLSSTPLNFIILGKPEIGQVEVAKLLSEQWKCVNINPESVITEELLSDSRAGKCISYNLRVGRAIEPEILLRLVEKRIKSQTAQHRGFIINGFPLLPNNNYKEDPISSESAIFNVQDIFEELLPSGVFHDDVRSRISISKYVSQAGEGTISESDVVESVEPVEEGTEGEESKSKIKQMSNVTLEKKLQDTDLGPSDLNIVNKTESFLDLANPKVQIKYLFKLLGDNPLVIIYLVCDNIDVICKRRNYRFDLYKEQELFFNSNTNDFVPGEGRKSVGFADKNNESTDNNIDGNIRPGLVKLPHNFRKSVSSQIREYKCTTHPIIEDKMLYFDPQYLIKVDGRLSPVKMFNVIRTRLKTLAFQPVLIPVKVKFDENVNVGVDDENKMNTISPESAFKLLKTNAQIGPMYQYQLSNWGFKCPVALKEGRIVKGKSIFAAKFMSKLFFLASKESFIKFYRNPRLYLLPIIPNPTCRIWIIGPNISGKSSVAKCLSLLYKCKVLQPSALEKYYEEVKRTEYIEKLRTAAITEALVTINKTRNAEREDTINEWKGEAEELLNEVCAYIDSDGKDDSNDMAEDFSYKLTALNLPSITQTNLLQQLRKNLKKLMKYLPVEFSRPIEPPTVFDQFVKNYVKTVLHNAEIPDMTLTFDEKIDMFKTAIQEAEDEYYQKHNIRGGWIVDGMSWDLEFLKTLCPLYLADDIICIRDTDQQHKFLISNFTNREYSDFRDFSAFFNAIKKYTVAETVYKSSFDSASRLNIVESLMNELQYRAASGTASKVFDEEAFANLKVLNYINHLNDFHFQWNVVRKYLEDIFGSNVIEIDPTGKTCYDLLKEAVINMENKYRKTATVMTPADREEELANYSGEPSPMHEEIDEDDDEQLGEGEIPMTRINFFRDNRRLGDTNIYCPVTFDRHFVLWKGRDEFAVSFQDTVYFLSCESAKNEFVSDPRLFVNNKPIAKFPPPRICVIGQTGSGKTMGATSLGNNYGLCYINFDHLLLDAFNLPNEDINTILRMDMGVNSDILVHADKLPILKAYLQLDKPLDKEILNKILTPLWFHEPYLSTGFILDNFPRRPSDVEYMKSNFLIPDIVIELLVTQDIANNRKFDQCFDQRVKEIETKKLLLEEENEMKFNKWQEDRFNRLQVLMQEKKENRRSASMGQSASNRKLTTPVDSHVNLEKIEETVEEELPLPPEDDFEYDMFQEKQDLEEVNLILTKEMPVPVFEIKLPTKVELTEQIRSEIDEDFVRDLAFFDTLRMELQIACIDYSNISTSIHTEDKVFYELLRTGDSIYFRNKSFFERVYEISMYTADVLLEQGFYFMSRFGRTCPVQIYENINPIQMFLPGEYAYIFPLIYRRYIYFVYTAQSRDKFKNDPLKYTYVETYRSFPLIPARIAIIGPPKCGKSILAERFRKTYSFKLITRGKAIRYVQKYLPQCELTVNMNKVLEHGWSLTYEMVAKSVETLTFDTLSLTQGYIMDGFPNTEEEMNYFIRLGIVPHIIIDIRASLDKIREFLATEISRAPFPTYSFEFMKFKYRDWKRKTGDNRKFLHSEYQNLYPVENIHSKWHLFHKANEIILKQMKEFHNYLYRKNFDVVLDLTSICLTPYEFFERQTKFRNYCPICWYYHDILENSDRSPDRSKVLQYSNGFYYVCRKHRELFMEYPSKYIPANNYKYLPEYLPIIVNESQAKSFYQDGLCIVCFWDSQPDHVLQQGDNKFIIQYNEKYYRLCSEACSKKFMQKPYKYYSKVINFRDTKKMDLGDLTKLPTMGYLEQLVGKLIIDSVVNTEILRPYHPYLTVAQSAALNMGMFLKIHNPKTPEAVVTYYQEAKEKFDFKLKKLKAKIEYFKGRINPFLCLDDMVTEPYKYARTFESDSSSEEEIIAVPPPSRSLPRSQPTPEDYDFYYMYGE